jgi:signal transduction histidine kinase
MPTFLRSLYASIVQQISEKPISIRTNIFFVEWIILLISLLIFIITKLAFPNAYSDLSRSNYIITASIFTCMALSFIFPIYANLWLRRGYILIELCLAMIFIDSSKGIYLFFVICKGVFLLPRKDLIIFILFSGFIFTFDSIWYKYEYFTEIKNNWCKEYNLQNTIFSTTISSLSVYLSSTIFIVFISSIILAEKKSRQRAEHLTQEVKILAANLERNRIARDIHDSLGHNLTALNVQVELAQNLYQHQSTKTLETIDTVKILADRCLQDVRRSVQTMRQSEFNLNEALQTLIDNFRQNSNLTINAEVNLPPLPLQTKHQLYCIVQEALTNIQKHARASSVNLLAYSTSEEFILEITDNGRGFDRHLPSSGYGLRGIEERVYMLNGELQITSILGQGTQIQAKIPL